MTHEEIKTVIDLFLTWNGRDEPIDIANLDFAVDFIKECLESEAPSKEIKGDLENAAKDYSEGYWNDVICKISSRSFIAGAKWDRAKMLEGTVDGRYMKADGKVYVESWPLDIDPDSVKAGDEVRLIVLPKED